ncbi:MAG: hypothetical protein ABI906_09315 [Pseudomonadota bacterium]
MDKLTQNLTSKSAKIRALSRAGAATARIADYLGIRYQFAYNVIKNGVSPEPDESPSVESIVGASPVRLKIGMNGEIVVPPDLLAAIGLSAGEEVFIQSNEDFLVLMGRQAAADRVRSRLSELSPEAAELFDQLVG